MGYAYEWLTETEKNNISEIHTDYDVNKIRIGLTVLEIRRSFEYTKVGGIITTVVDVQKKEDALINNKYFVDVACEDLHMLVVHQKSKLSLLAVAPYVTYDQNAMDPIINKIFEHLSQSLASRSSPFETTKFMVSSTKVSEGMSVIRHLDQSELREVTYWFEGRNEPGKIDDTMIDWNGDSGWKDLNFRFKNLTREDLEGLNKIASSQRFDGISVFFETCDEENIGSFFDSKLLSLDVSETKFSIASFQLTLNPHIKRARPSSSERKRKVDQLVESMEALSISGKLALEVLGNSVIMKNILVELRFFDIQRLRKVCRGVRDCIDDVKPEPHITVYKVDDWVYIASKHEAIRIKYHCEDHVLNDFHINLMHQKTCLEELRVRATTNFSELLKGRKTALKVESLTIHAQTHEDVMQILPYLDKDFLKKIRIILQRIIIDVAEMARTDQWKRASQLLIEGNQLITPIREMNITHFSTVDVLMKTLSSDDVVYLKTELLKSSTLEKFRIKFRRSDINERLQTLIGEPYRITSNFKKIWYFRMPYTDYYLHIALDTQDIDDEYGFPEPKTIVFSKVPKEDTPFFQ